MDDIGALEREMTMWRHHLHAHPETGFDGGIGVATRSPWILIHTLALVVTIRNGVVAPERGVPGTAVRRRLSRLQGPRAPMAAASDTLAAQARKRHQSRNAALRAFVGGETPFSGRCSNGGFWSSKVENALSFNQG